MGRPVTWRCSLKAKDLIVSFGKCANDYGEVPASRTVDELSEYYRRMKQAEQRLINYVAMLEGRAVAAKTLTTGKHDARQRARRKGTA
jgi:hypothetical protein